MNDQKTNFLINIAKEESLKNNLLSIILARNPDLNLSKKETFFDNVRSFYKEYNLVDRLTLLQFNSPNETEFVSNWENKDYRISRIYVSNLKAYPKSEIPFGIDFTDNNNNITSHIIIGSNGVGKSTIFNALEYTFTKRIGEAELRTTKTPLEDGDKYFKDYLCHFSNTFEDCEFKVLTKSGETLYLNMDNIPLQIRKELNPNNHFISEFDITTNCKLDFESNQIDSFNSLIAKNIGLSDLVDLDKEIYQFSTYNRLTESNNLKKAKSSLDDNKSKLLTYNKQIIELQEKLNLLPLSTEDKIEKSNIELKEKLKSLIEINYDFDININELRDIFFIHNELKKEVKKISSKNNNFYEIDFLQAGLKLLDHKENCPFCENSSYSKNEIRIQVEDRINNHEEYSNKIKRLENVSSEIFEKLNVIFNKLFQLRNSLENEIEFSNKTFIKEGYNDTLTDLRNILINSTSHDIIGDFEINKNKFSSSTFQKSEFIGLVFERGYDYIFEYLPTYVSDLRNLDGKRKSYLKTKIENLSKFDIESDNFIKKTLLKKEIDQLNTEIETLKENSNILEKSYELSLKELEFFKNVKDEAKELYKIIHKQITDEISKVFEPLKDIIIAIINDYLNNSRKDDIEIILDNEPDEKDLETGEIISTKIVAYIRIKKTNERISVNRYFNTFHYKLFSTMVAISIAIASREKTRINLPLVLDDIFYSSDFGNRATIEKFLDNLFELFEKYTPNLPLQLIMFTHDNMIFDSAIHSLSASEKNNIQFGKLFDFSESIIEDDYRKILSKIPTKLPFKILSKVYA
ncbi:AAA family ATPase [Sphingobacterium cellulitidis]|uniref:AAA family ATPase n=1 Tax=Sphingobacterium cellulitidis TaxID=1768011 RepID=UPI003C7A2C37